MNNRQSVSPGLLVVLAWSANDTTLSVTALSSECFLALSVPALIVIAPGGSQLPLLMPQQLGRASPLKLSAASLVLLCWSPPVSTGLYYSRLFSVLLSGVL